MLKAIKLCLSNGRTDTLTLSTSGSLEGNVINDLFIGLYIKMNMENQ